MSSGVRFKADLLVLGACRRRSITTVMLLLIATLLLAGSAGETSSAPSHGVVVLVSADAEWRVVRALYPDAAVSATPYGEFFSRSVTVSGRPQPVIVFHGGWGKIAAAGSTQYAIERFKPDLLVNLGTCGGFQGAIEKKDVILVDQTVVYDIVEQMGDAAEAIAEYTTMLDIGWVGSTYPKGVRPGQLLSADRDILVSDVPMLKARYGAVAADWESGAIAWVARRNGTNLLILRGVTDLVGAAGGEAYGAPEVYEAGSRDVMADLFSQLPFWLERWSGRKPKANAVPKPK
jgi:adenosylhomocysteine nucleosidase